MEQEVSVSFFGRTNAYTLNEITEGKPLTFDKNVCNPQLPEFPPRKRSKPSTSTGARHLIAIVGLKELLPEKWTGTRADQCQRHGLLDICPSVSFVLAFHLIALHVGMVFLSTFCT
jgi:hypothetical protein